MMRSNLVSFFELQLRNGLNMTSTTLFGNSIEKVAFHRFCWAVMENFKQLVPHVRKN